MQTNITQSSTRISFQDNPYLFEERHARLSEPLEPVTRQVPLSEPNYEPVYNIYPPLQQDLNRTRHQSQNQITLEINRQIIHPRQNRNLQNPRVQFSIPHSPTTNPTNLSSSTIQSTPQTPAQQKTSNIHSDYLGSTPTSEQIRENHFKPPATTEHLPFWMTQAFTQGEPNLTNLINDPIDISSDTFLSLTEILSLPSTPSLTPISQTPIPPNFPINLDARYRENSTNNIQLRLDWNTFVAPPPLFGQNHESHRLDNWALNRLEYLQDIHKDIQDHNIQILRQDNLTLKFEIAVKLINIVHHPLPVAPKNITVQSLPPPFITTEILYKYDRYTKKTIGYITFYNPYSGLSYTCIF